MNRASALVACVVAVTASCTTEPGPSAPSPPTSAAAGSIALPSPEHRGDQVTVEGVATWITRRPGCLWLDLASGQRFQLVGAAAAVAERRAAVGEQPPTQRVRITGYVPEVGATVCGNRAFVTETVTPVHR